MKCALSIAVTLFTSQMLVQPVMAQETSWRDIESDVVYGHKMGMALTYDVIRPTENANGAGILYMVSGGWVSRYFDPSVVIRPEKPETLNLWETLVDHGYTLFLVRHGSSPLFKVPDAVSDVKIAVQHIRANCERFDVDADRLGVCGGSAGGHLSLMLGTTGEDPNPEAESELERAGSRVAAVVAYFPPTEVNPIQDPEDAFARQFPALVFDEDDREAVSPLFHVSTDDAPTLLVHGDRDELVPLSHSEKIVEAFEAESVINSLVVIEGAGHGFGGEDGERAQAALVDWFNVFLND